MCNEFKIKIVLIFFFMYGLLYVAYLITKIPDEYFTASVHKNRSDRLLNEKIMIENFLKAKTLNLLNFLEDDVILKDKSAKSIFFLETHMDDVRILKDPRQACSIESAAFFNQDSTIYLILLTRSNHVDLEYSEIGEMLLLYDNIRIRYLNPYEFSKDTPLADLMANDTILSSEYKLEHMADVMRALLLSKYCGLYLDLDIFSIVPVSFIEFENFACPESLNRITNAVIKVDEKGQEVMKAYVRKLSTDYNAKKYSDNGPKLFSESIKSFCNGTELVPDNYTKCGDFQILPNTKCYPIGYGGYKKFFEASIKEGVLQKIRDSKSFFVHVWNKMQELQNKRFIQTYESNSAYIDLAKLHCPRVFKTREKYFR